MGGRTQHGWKVSYLCKSIKHDLLSSSSICSAVVQQVCGLRGHKFTRIDNSSSSQQYPFHKSTIFAPFLHWTNGSGWHWAVTNCDGALADTRLIHELVEGWAGGVLPAQPMGSLWAQHGPPLLPIRRSCGLPQEQLWLLHSAVLCGRQAHFQNAFLTHTSCLSRHAILLFSILRIFFFGGSVAVQQSSGSDLYKRLGKGKNCSFLLCPLQCLCDL